MINQNTRFALMEPPGVLSKFAPQHSHAPPLGLAYIAEKLIVEGYEFDVIDSLGEGIDHYDSTDNPRVLYRGLSIDQILARIPKNCELLMISAMFTMAWNHTKRIIQEVKKAYPNIKILLGGETATSLHELIFEICPEVDFICLGEGDEYVSDFLRVFFYGGDFDSVDGLVFRKNGQIVKTKRRERISDMNSIPWPKWEKFPLENYLSHSVTSGVGSGRIMPIIGSRGCPYKCTFCTAYNMWDVNYYNFPIQRMMEQIQYYKDKYRIEALEFHDLTLFVNKKFAVEFCKGLIDYKINLPWNITVGTRAECVDEEVVDLLIRSGCNYFTFAPESGSKKTLEYIQKKVDIDKYLKSIQIVAKKGVTSKINIIIGFPDEERKEIYTTLLFIIKCAYYGVEDISMTVYFLSPGSKLFNEFIEENNIKMDEEFFETYFIKEFVKLKKSCSRHVGRKELIFYRTLGNLLFYSIGYLFHPMRILRLIKGYFKKTHTSKLEKFLLKHGQYSRNRFLIK
jgi:anaerobic magnesium-protoporphyrin IX monomethyl ester cyclase